jgi:Ca2+-binding RTX toxin-like protein
MKRRVMLLVGAMALALVMIGGVALAEAVSCSTDPCKGTPEDDQISGTNNAETIKALAGDDSVFAFDGNDIVYGGDGKDLVDGFGGNDRVHGGDGDDTLAGAEDSDMVRGRGGDDRIDAASFDTPGSEDFSSGGRGNDTIFAQDGNKDVIDCGKGKRDTVFFDEGLDTTENCEIKNPTTVSGAAADTADMDLSQRQR